MQRMIDDEAMYNNMAHNARRMIASRFEQSFVRKCLFDYYDQII